MAHFAELKSEVDPTGFTSDTHLVVQRVVVIGNDVPTSNGLLENNDMHVDGETYCGKLFKTETNTWKQTSYNHNFRKQYCGKGYVYDPVKDIFLAPQPYASWTLNVDNNWVAPVEAPPSDKHTYLDGSTEHMYNIVWNEDNLKWIATDHNDQAYDWDPSGLDWVAV
tara:strand:+ start:204 stop:701 length:498 start_codon:yes stop_codon:yes gene_type:complete